MGEEVTRFEELSDEQVLLLTTEDVERWIDVECAFEGIPLLPERPVEPLDVKIVPDVTVHEVSGMFFDTADDARKAIEFLDGLSRCELGYVHGPRFERIYKGPAQPLSITSHRVFTQAAWNQIAAVANAAAEKKTEYNTRWNEFEKIDRQRKSVVERIRNRQEEISRKEFARQRMRGNLTRYMELAKGNRVLAIRFLKDAYPNAAELLPEIDEPLVGPDASIPPRAYAPADALDNINSAPERL